MRWRQSARQAIFEQKMAMKMADFHIGFSLKIGACGALKLTFGGVNRRRRHLSADRPTDSFNLGRGSSVGFCGAPLRRLFAKRRGPACLLAACDRALLSSNTSVL